MHGFNRLFSRQIVFGIGRKVEVIFARNYSIICKQDQNGYKKKAVETLLVELQVMLKT